MSAPLPAWARPKSTGGVPAPDSPLDRQFAAFVGPRWPVYRRKFAPFFADGRFTPTWNWAAALLFPLLPLWFIYRKLYLPFVAFLMLPGLAFSLLWGGELPVRMVENPFGGAPMQTLAPEAAPVALGILLSWMLMAGGTANFLLYRRAMAAIRFLGQRDGDPEAKLPLLNRVGGTSWRGVGLGLAVFIGLQLLGQLGGAAR